VEAFYEFMLSFFIPEAAMTNIWEEIKDQIRGVIPEKSFSLWINPLTLLEQSDDALVLGCPNKFSLNWVHGELHSSLPGKPGPDGRKEL